jgi:hypothetical protein
MTNLRHVRAGEKLRIGAGAYNAFVDAARAHRRVPHDLSRASEPSHGASRQTTILVRNESEEDVPRFGCLAIGDPIIPPDENADEFANRPSLIGVAPMELRHFGSCVVACEPIAAGKIGKCVLRGITPARVLMADVRHTHADIAEGHRLLKTGFVGAARILWRPDEAGEVVCLVEIGPLSRDRITVVIGKAHPFAGVPFGWRYEWEEARLDDDPASMTFGQWVPLSHLDTSSEAQADGLKAGPGEPEMWAYNRHEGLLLRVFPQTDEGIDGFANMGACLVPGALEQCPPPQAVVPMIRPVLEGATVELRAERTLSGETAWVFEAFNPVEWTRMTVPPLGGGA